MSYDRTKVDITEEEHVAAEALDSVIDAFRDGVQFEDVSVFGDAKEVFEYLRGTEVELDKSKVADKLIALGFCMYRDNVTLILG